MIISIIIFFFSICIIILCSYFRCHTQEQLTLCIRYSKNLEVYERFIEFYDVSENQNADSLVAVLLHFINSSNLSNVPITGQSYDGAVVMSGSVRGVQTKLRQSHPLASQAVYVHCMAHKVNLVVVDMCKHLKVMISINNVDTILIFEYFRMLEMYLMV